MSEKSCEHCEYFDFISTKEELAGRAVRYEEKLLEYNKLGGEMNEICEEVETAWWLVHAGHCHRLPPVALLPFSKEENTAYEFDSYGQPVIKKTGWCGEFIER